MFSSLKRKIIHLRNKVFGIPEKGDLVKSLWINPEQVYLVLDAYKIGSGSERYLNVVLLNLKTNVVVQIYWSANVTIVARAEDPQSATW